MPTKFLSAKAAAAKLGAKGISSRFLGSSSKDIASSGSTKNADRDDGEEISDNEGPNEKTSADGLRRKELLEVMKDRSLSKEEKARRMEMVKQKYPKSDDAAAATATQSSASVKSDGPPSRSNNGMSSSSIGMSAPPPPGGVDLSAKGATSKSKREVKGLFRRGRGGKTPMGSSKENYEKQLLLDKPAEKQEGETTDYDGDIAKDQQRPPPSLDAQRRSELQIAMKDKSLNKDERRRRMEEINERYKSLSEARERHVDINLSAKSYARKPKKELESTPVKSFSERRSMYENQSPIVAGVEYQQRNQKRHTKDKSTLKLHAKHRAKLGVNVDPTSFALAENGLYGVQSSKKKSVSHEYGGRF